MITIKNDTWVFREATTTDVKQLYTVRNSVDENRLSNPDLVNETAYISYLTIRGKGWVCEAGDRIVGFSVVDLACHNVWALFVLPEYSRRGIGRHLHDMMLDWYFSQTSETIWLGTDPETRAAHFYRRAGWIEAGALANGELRFEMTTGNWKK